MISRWRRWPAGKRQRTSERQQHICLQPCRSYSAAGNCNTKLRSCSQLHKGQSLFLAKHNGLAGNQSDGCNAVQDTVLQAVALSNKGISVSCNKPLDHVFKPPQHRLRNSLAEAWSKACQTLVNYALIYSRSGILTTMLCLEASRSSRTATGESCGHALIVQQDAPMSGRQL
ncbi:TPA: hypothetical protein ACH3X3_008265 [Trebouxia sp. C0006]